MSEPILEQLAYGGPRTWRDLLQNTEPHDDGSGMLAAPWGDAIRRAKQIEKQEGDWQQNPAYAENGPAGVVLNFLRQLGHDPWVEFGGRTEEAANRGDLQMRGGGAPLQESMEIETPNRKGSSGRSRALNALARVPSVEVQEKASLIEALTALLGAEIEMANKYNVFDDQGQPLLYAVETTDCFTRNLKQCCPDCASWSVNLLFTQNGAEEQAFEMKREWTCTCCCLNRPVVNVNDVTTGQTMGSIVDPFACCDLTFKLRGPDEQDVLLAKGGCCQPGLCCPLPCGPCSEVNFPITDAQSGEEVGHIQKKVPSCMKFLFAGDVDNYQIEFGAVQNPEFKVLIIAMAIFIDFRYFNDNKNDGS